MSSKARSRSVSTRKRSRSPSRRRLPSSSTRKRSPLRRKTLPRDTREPRYMTQKEKDSVKRRNGSPSRVQRGRRRSHSIDLGRKWDLNEKVTVRHSSINRFQKHEKNLMDKPFFSGPENKVMMDRDSLKKIVIVNMRNSPTASGKMKRDIINPEQITVVRRTGEGLRPIFERDEIVNFGRHSEGGDRLYRRQRSVSSSPLGPRRYGSPDRDRSPISSRTGFRRRLGSREYSPRRRSDFRSESNDRRREERYRTTSRRRSPSYDRLSAIEPSRRDRFSGGGRRNHERESSRERTYRRRQSPDVSRGRDVREKREFERPFHREELEPSHARCLILPPEEDYSGNKYFGEGHGYYEGEMVENYVLPPVRGRGRGIRVGGRGMPPIRAVIRPGGVIIPSPPTAVPDPFLPRGPVPVRRLPLHPRMVRPILRPVIRVVAPVVPIRPPVLPVRHPVILQ